MSDLLAGISPVARRHLRRNYAMGVLNGVAYRVAETMLDSSLVLSWFVSQLTASSFLVGLIAPIRNGGWFLPQLLISGYVQRQERKLPLYWLCGTVRVISLGLLTLSVWLLGPRQTGLLLVAFFVLITVFSLGEGFSGVSFLDIVAKTIPSRRRGSFFAIRSFLGGVLALGSSLWVRYVLDERSGLAFPSNFGLLFGASLVFVTIGVAGFSLVVEPLEPTDPQVVPLGRQLAQAWACVRRDRNFARLILVRALLILGTGLSAPFYIVYAKNVLNAPASSVGSYLLALTLASIASNLFWGRVSDRYGNRLVILLSAVIGLAVPCSALLAGQLRSLALLFIPFALEGIYQGSIMVGHVGFVLDIAPPAERPLYIGFINTALGVVSLALSFSGVVVGLVGYLWLFAISGLFLVAGLIVAWGLRDPRRDAG